MNRSIRNPNRAKLRRGKYVSPDEIAHHHAKPLDTRRVVAAILLLLLLLKMVGE